MQTAILVLNLVVSFASAGWAVAVLIRPGILSGSTNADPGEVFYAHMYAARALPLGIATGLLPLHFHGGVTASTLFAAAVVQIADVAIALGRKERGMAFGASAGAVVHLLCGVAIL